MAVRKYYEDLNPPTREEQLSEALRASARRTNMWRKMYHSRCEQHTRALRRRSEDIRRLERALGHMPRGMGREDETVSEAVVIIHKYHVLLAEKQLEEERKKRG